MTNEHDKGTFDKSSDRLTLFVFIVLVTSDCHDLILRQLSSWKVVVVFSFFASEMTM